MILEVNGQTVHSADVIKPFLSTSGRRVSVTYVSVGNHVGRRAKTIKSRSLSEGSRVKRARNLHDRVSI